MGDLGEEELAAALRTLGRRLGKTHGAKGAATTNSLLTPKQRKRNASKAGKAAARNMTPEARSARAKAAVAAREKKKKGEPDQLTNKSEGTEV